MDDIRQLPDEDLWSRLADADGRDRLEILFELGGRASRRGDGDRAMTLWQEAEAVAEEIDDHTMVAEALRLQGAAAFYSGNYELAIDLYGKAARGHEQVGQTREAAGALWCLADSYGAVGDSENQLKTASESRKLAEYEQDHSLAGDACQMQARALYLLNRDEEALAACVAARDFYRTAEKPAKVAEVDDFAITVNLYLDNLDEALQLARGCLVLARISSTEEDDAHARMRLANVFLQRGDIDDALEQAGIALLAYKSHDNFVGAATCEQLRGEAFLERAETSQALAAFADARVIFDATGRDHEALRCETRLAVALHYAGDCRAAARANRGLVDAYRQMEDQQSNAQWSVVRLLDNLHEAGEHHECLQAAEDLMDAWPAGSTAEDPSYREYLGLYAHALEQCGQSEQATAMASHVIANTPSREAGLSTAYCYQVRGTSRLLNDEAAASQDFSHAIALLLARGRVDRARELSTYFLPVDGGAGSRGSTMPWQGEESLSPDSRGTHG